MYVQHNSQEKSNLLSSAFDNRPTLLSPTAVHVTSFAVWKAECDQHAHVCDSLTPAQRREKTCALQGTVCVICGTGLAAITAFSVSRGVGRKLAQRVVSDELKSESSEQSVVVESKFQGIQDAIDQGSFAQQSIAVAMLRLTPVIPFRYWSYLLLCVV